MPLFRVLSYSYFEEIDTWISDRYVNDFMESVSLDGTLWGASFSALLCTSACFPGIRDVWRWNDTQISLRRSASVCLPSFIELGPEEEQLDLALTSIANSMKVDLLDIATGEPITSDCYVVDVDVNNGIVLADERLLIERLIENR